MFPNLKRMYQDRRTIDEPIREQLQQQLFAWWRNDCIQFI